jgi:hypothetical protein
MSIMMHSSTIKWCYSVHIFVILYTQIDAFITHRAANMYILSARWEMNASIVQLAVKQSVTSIVKLFVQERNVEMLRVFICTGSQHIMKIIMNNNENNKTDCCASELNQLTHPRVDWSDSWATSTRTQGQWMQIRSTVRWTILCGRRIRLSFRANTPQWFC